MRALRLLLVSILSLLAVLPGNAASQLMLPPTTGVFDYQLGEAYDRLPDGRAITVVVRDVSQAPLAGAYNICYLNGFQTQPGTLSVWEALPVDVLLRDTTGYPIVDPAWPDEVILDPSTPAQRGAILRVIAPQIRDCAAQGFDAIEFDNLDTWLRFPQIDADGTLALAQAYIALTHEQGLAVAQKNTAELANPDAPLFDFAIVEECAVFDECQDFAAAYGDHVLQVEYPDALDEAGISFAEVCAAPDLAPLTILRDRDLTAPRNPAWVYESCADTSGKP